MTCIVPRVHNYTEESIEHWNKSAESNVTSGALHVIVHGAHSHLLHLSAAVPLKSLRLEDGCAASAYTRGAKKILVAH